MGLFDFLSDIPIVGDVIDFIDDNYDSGKDALSSFAPYFSAAAGAVGQGGANQINLQIARENSAFNANQAEANRNFQSQSALDARNFEQYNSDTAWRRGVADMSAAGINPMLAVMKGGATSPTSSGSSGSVGQAMQPAPMQSKVAAALAGYSTAVDVAKREQEVRLMQQEYRIKEQTLEKGSKLIGGGLDAVPGAAKALAEKVADAVMAIEDAAGGVKSGANPVVSKFIETGKVVSQSLDAARSAPERVSARFTASAAQAADRLRRIPEGSIRMGKDVIGAGSFTGNRATDLRDIAGIKDIGERKRALASYRLFLDKRSRQ